MCACGGQTNENSRKNCLFFFLGLFLVFGGLFGLLLSLTDQTSIGTSHAKRLEGIELRVGIVDRTSFLADQTFGDGQHTLFRQLNGQFRLFGFGIVLLRFGGVQGEQDQLAKILFQTLNIELDEEEKSFLREMIQGDYLKGFSGDVASSMINGNADGSRVSRMKASSTDLVQGETASSTNFHIVPTGGTTNNGS